MARYTCQRCGQVCHTTEAEHLCKDLARRLARQQAQVEAVKQLIEVGVPEYDDMGDRFYPIYVEEVEQLALDIVRALNRLDITSDA